MNDLIRKQVGECIITRHWEDGSLTVDRADPRIHVSAVLLEAVRRGDGDPEVTLAGDVLRIDAANRKVIYRIGEKDPELDVYHAEWPD